MATVNNVISQLTIIGVFLLLTPGCVVERFTELPSSHGSVADTTREQKLRQQMVERQLRVRNIYDSRVLTAMAMVPRHRFVPPSLQLWAYEDRPLPIGYRQTISQPYIVAYMTQELEVSPGDTVLEIGTGSGYQAAILAELVQEVFTIEIVPELAAQAELTLRDLGYENVHSKLGDGYRGWPEHGPFDGILVTAAPDHVPQSLVDQLAVNGKLVIPVGKERQNMTIIKKTDGGVIKQETIPVVFVPMTGEVARE